MCQILGASHVGCPPILRIPLTSLSVAEQASVEAGSCLVGWAVHALVRLGLYFQLERGRFPPPDFHFALLSFHWNFQGKYTFTLRAVQEILEIPFCPPPPVPARNFQKFFWKICRLCRIRISRNFCGNMQAPQIFPCSAPDVATPRLALGQSFANFPPKFGRSVTVRKFCEIWAATLRSALSRGAKKIFGFGSGAASNLPRQVLRVRHAEVRRLAGDWGHGPGLANVAL